MWICIVCRREHTSKVLRYGMHSQGISQFYVHTPRSSANGMNQLKPVIITDPGRMEGWVGLGLPRSRLSKVKSITNRQNVLPCYIHRW